MRETESGRDIWLTIKSVLDRECPPDTLTSLIASLKRTQIEEPPLSDIAICFDSNVFLRLGKHARRDDIVDYLHSGHVAPLILPSQVIQEFWNNQLAAVDTVARGLKKKHDDFERETRKVHGFSSAFHARMEDLLNEFSSRYGLLYDEATLRDTIAVLELFQTRSIVSYAPRTLFSAIAANRNETKTPPGFKDPGHGDFYVWVEFLGGLMRAIADGSAPSHAVLITRDSKADWSRENAAHPILQSEVRALTGCSFAIWDIDDIVSRIP